MRIFLYSALLMTGSIGAVPADARLLDQSVDGAQRLCFYELSHGERRWVPSLGTWVNSVVVKIGRGEPCPATYAEPTPDAATIPSLAMLKSEGRSGNKKSCVYSYLGRDYTKLVTPTAMCTLSPN